VLEEGTEVLGWYKHLYRSLMSRHGGESGAESLSLDCFVVFCLNK
jgi:hypothetical protein